MAKAGPDDVVLVGDTGIRVAHRGEMAMKNSLSRKAGRNATDLIFYDVAFSSGLLHKLDKR